MSMSGDRSLGEGLCSFGYYLVVIVTRISRQKAIKNPHKFVHIQALMFSSI